MSEDKDPNVSVIELQEQFIQHVERGGRKIIVLALIATLAGAYFAANYFLQLVVLPYGLGITSPPVNLVDPGVVAVGAVSFVIALAWTVAGVRDLVFARKLARQVREIRGLQERLAEKYGLGGMAIAGAEGD